MASSKTVQIVTDLVKGPIEALNLRLWDVRFLKEGASWYLRIFIDSDDGIDINNCTDVSRAIEPIIDEVDPISVPYFLEVCSPGISRELVTKEHFDIMNGRNILVKTIRPHDNKRDFKGVLIAFDGTELILGTDEGEIKFANKDISSVKLDDDV